MGMRLAWLVAMVLVPAGTAIFAQEVDLQPEQRIEIKLEGFPPCLLEMEGNSTVDKFVTAVLPEDYVAIKKFPLLIFLHGGNGGIGNNPNDALFFAERKHFIAVSMPLFKKELNKSGTAIYINPADFKHVAKQYLAILKLLREKIPNIADKGYVGAGFSNGAHSLAAIGDDRELSKLFSHYILAEGGSEMNKVPRDAKIIVLIGEKSPYGNEGLRLDKNGKVKSYPRQFMDIVKKKKVVTFVPMIGTGHEFPEKYRIVARDWLNEQYPGIAGK